MAPKKRERRAAAPPTATTRLTRSATAGKRVAPAAAPVKLPAKKLKPATAKAKAPAPVDDGKEEPKASGGEASKTIIIEACKQCNSFKTRAIAVKEGLENAVSDITVDINPEKPRRGCFEIRDADGFIFLSLLDLKRPFKPMKDLDMDEVIEDIVKKIN